MIPVLLYKYLSFTVNITADTGHATNTNYNTKYSIIYYLATNNTLFSIFVDC